MHFERVVVMNRRTSSTPSLHRPPDFTRAAPFVPPEVFRLVLRLEAQKALDVNVAALEQRFRVPPGYADDDSLNARGELKQPKNFVPGPGAYEVPDQWPLRDVTATPTAAFLSRTLRRSFSPSRRVASASPISPTRQDVMARIANGCGEKAGRPHTAIPELQCVTKASTPPRRRLGLPSPSGRPNLLVQLPDVQRVDPYSGELTDMPSYSSLNPLNVSAFSKVGRESGANTRVAPAVGSYDIKRLWDSSARRITLGAPSPALFGASREKRVMTWRPALTPASYTVSTSWDSSRHYAKVKDQVVRSAAKRRLHIAKLHARAMSSSTLRLATAEASNASNAGVASTETAEDDDDPFSWLRHRPNGEHRVNVLAAKHGLVHHIKSPTRRSTDNRNANASHGDEQPTPGTPMSRLVQDDGDVADTEPQYTAKVKDVRIKVSCRMPGGMLITASVYSMKKLGHFKSAILVRQKRFQMVEQFDLYHTSGRKLAGLEDTLVTCGVQDRSMLQIVPAAVVALSPNQAPNDTK